MKNSLVKSFEGLRGGAALMVALYHVPGIAQGLPMVRFGYLFVDLFFVLSGFVIAAAYMGRLTGVRDTASFLVRRFGRLYPLLVFSSIAYVVIANSVPAGKAVLVHLGHTQLLRDPGALNFYWPTARELISTLTLTQGMNVNDTWPINGVSWSISVEFWAYVLFAVLVLSLGARTRLAVLLLIATTGFALLVATGVQTRCETEHKCLDFTLDLGYVRCVSSFLFGVALWHVRNAVPSLRRPAQIATAVGMMAMFYGMQSHPWLAFALPLVFGVLVWSVAHDDGWIARGLGCDLGLKLGERSYSIYLLHPVILMGIRPLTDRAHDSVFFGLLMVGFYVLVLYGVAGLVYSRLEVPARDYFNGLAAKLANRRNPGAAPLSVPVMK